MFLVSGAETPLAVTAGDLRVALDLLCAGPDSSRFGPIRAGVPPDAFAEADAGLGVAAEGFEALDNASVVEGSEDVDFGLSSEHGRRAGARGFVFGLPDI